MVTKVVHFLNELGISLVDRRPALDVKSPPTLPTLDSLVDAILDDFNPFAIEELADKQERRVYFFFSNDRDSAKNALNASLGSRGVTAVSLEIPNDQWAERSQAQLRPVKVGNIVVTQPWNLTTIEPRATLVIIRPSMGFGTGHHESTRTCLRILQEVPIRNRTVLDLGTGSGVLAIAASKLGSNSIIAVDQDLDALKNAQDNIKLNEINSGISLRHCNFTNTHDLPCASIVITNTTSVLVIKQTTKLLKYVTSGGTLIVGGIMKCEETAVRNAYLQTATVIARVTEGEWLALAFNIKN